MLPYSLFFINKKLYRAKAYKSGYNQIILLNLKLKSNFDKTFWKSFFWSKTNNEHHGISHIWMNIGNTVSLNR